MESHGTLRRQAVARAITKREVEWTDAQGAPQRTAADSVVLAIGAESDDSLARELSVLGLPQQSVGDCASVGYIEGAMHGGHGAGLRV